MHRGIGLALLAFLLSTAVGFGALSGSPASGNHIYNTYGQRGYLEFASGVHPILWVSSTRCNPRELEAYDAIESSTANKAPLNSRWSQGIQMTRHGCEGEVGLNTDIKLQYEADFPGNYGGYNVSNLASRSYCDTFGRNYPCGSHISIVHLNLSRFTSSSFSYAYRKRLIMHETGHSLGLAHHCSGDSILNDGTSGCNGGAWTNVMGYLLTDRRGVYNIYPNWSYQ